MRYPCAYKVEGSEVKDFKDLDDDRALKLIALIYNVQHQTWEGGVARRIALEQYQGLIAKRKSDYIKKSGILEMQYEKVLLAKWKGEDLVKLYDCLYPKACTYYRDAAPELNEAQNAERITYLTAIEAVVKELKRRDATDKAVMIAGQVLSTLLTVAMAMI